MFFHANENVTRAAHTFMTCKFNQYYEWSAFHPPSIAPFARAFSASWRHLSPGRIFIYMWMYIISMRPKWIANFGNYVTERRRGRRRRKKWIFWIIIRWIVVSCDFCLLLILRVYLIHSLCNRNMNNRHLKCNRKQPHKFFASHSFTGYYK